MSIDSTPTSAADALKAIVTSVPAKSVSVRFSVGKSPDMLIDATAMTTKSHPYPTRVRVKHRDQTGWVVLDQIRTIDQSRILRIVGKLNPTEIADCKRIIKETFVD